MLLLLPLLLLLFGSLAVRAFDSFLSPLIETENMAGSRFVLLAMIACQASALEVDGQARLAVKLL